MKIKHKYEIKNDKYTQYIYDNFDIQNKEINTTEILYDLSGVIDKDWNIGVIYGNSGSGKSSILKDIGYVDEINLFDDSKPLISNFNWMSPKEACFLLTSMGLSSVPTWLRPYKVLSNGEKYRAYLAYIVGRSDSKDILLIDEFTSVVDRDVAKAMSVCLSKYIKRTNKKIILASCHLDILEWLEPDFICSPQKNNGIAEWVKYRLKRPIIKLQVSRVESEAWDIFKEHHYLTDKVNKSCKFFLFEWNNKPVGIVVLATNPSGTVLNSFRLSRTVVLPDYQGLGIGSKISEFVASITNGRVFTKTVNPALGEYRSASDKWRETSKHMKKLKGQSKDNKENVWTTKTRPSYCHEYVGEKTNGYDFLMLAINEIRSKQQLKLF